MIVRTLERNLANKQFIANDSNRPDIDRNSIAPFEGLWGSIMECASIGPKLKFLVTVPLHSGNLEVTKLDVTLILVKEYILWFDVSMTDAFIVKIDNTR